MPKSQPPKGVPREASAPLSAAEEVLALLPKTRRSSARDLVDVERRESDASVDLTPASGTPSAMAATLSARRGGSLSPDPADEDVASMRARVVATERARETSEKRAMGLEEWTQVLEAKVAEARTRADEVLEQLEASRKDAQASRRDLESSRKDLDATRGELERTRSRLATVEVELATLKRESEDAIELERVKRGLEIDALVNQQQLALEIARRDASSPAAVAAARHGMAKVITMLEDFEREELAKSAVRAGLLEQARRFLTSEPTLRPPAPVPVQKPVVQHAGPPSTTRNPRKKRRPSAPPPAPKPPALSPVPEESFEDLDFGD